MIGSFKLLSKGKNCFWVMVLPIIFDFGGKSGGAISALGYGAKREFKIKLPKKPKKVE